MAYVAIADRDAPIHDPHTFIEKYIWSQDHKVIAIQYAIVAIFVGLVALVLSGLMRLQLGFPDTFHFVDPNQYYFRTTPWFETASDKYRFLNRIVCVGTGRRDPAGPVYEVFQIL